MCENLYLQYLFELVNNQNHNFPSHPKCHDQPARSMYSSYSSVGGCLGAYGLAASAMALICSGVVPQQPPTMFTSPSAAND